MKNNLVSVCLWGNEVGKLYWDERRRVAVFQFDTAFVEAGIDLSPIECPISSLAVSRRLPVDGIKDRMYQGLPAFICDSLPDRWGNEVFTAWCAQQGLSLHDITPVDRLAYMGKRAMGALEFMPAYDIDAHLDIELSALYRQAEEILRMRGSYAITPDQNISLDALYMVGTSAGGQQAKAVVAIDRESGEIRSGQTELPDSYDQYILNPQVTKQRLFYETMEKVLPGQKVIIDDGTTQTVLPLDSFTGNAAAGSAYAGTTAGTAAVSGTGEGD